MDIPQTKKNYTGTIITLSIVAVIIILVIVAGILISKSPLGKALGDLLGLFDGLAKTIEHQIKTCDKSGWFNVKDGCYLGVLGIGVGILYAIVSVVKLVYSGKGSVSDTVDKISAETGKTKSQVQDEIVEKVSEFQETDEYNKLSDTEKKATLEKIGNNKASNDLVDAINKSGKSPEEIKAKIQEAKTSYEQANEDINNDLTKDEIDNVDKTVDDFEPPPEFTGV